jgi:hypothetical protein
MSQRQRLQHRFRRQFHLAADHFPVLMALAVTLEIVRPKLTARVEGGMPGEGTRRLRFTLGYVPSAVPEKLGRGSKGGAGQTHQRIRINFYKVHDINSTTC